MQVRRILIVGNFDRRNLLRRYFNTEYKLANGFVRAGHHVLSFSDRDYAREATIWRNQQRGKAKMAERLIETAKHYQPHLILFGHADLLEESCFLRLKENLPNTRLACFCVDAVFRSQAMARFCERGHHMHASFSTTGERKRLQTLGLPKDTLFFMPNPVDASMETARVFESHHDSLRFDGQFLGTGIEKRDEQLSFLQKHLPDFYRFETGGRAFGSERLDSTHYLQQLAQAAVSPNLPLNDEISEQLPYLYSSDRIAQLLGQGVTSLCIAQSGLDDLYDDGIVSYASREDLVEKMVQLYHDDDQRRKIGAIGHRLAHERTNSQVIASYILSCAFGESSKGHVWNSEPV